MEITDIIKDAFTFPVNNLKALAIYIVITFVMGILSIGGVAFIAFSANNGIYIILAAILIILAIIIGFVLSGYEIDIIKTGIDFEELAPGIDFKNDFVRGIKAVVVAIVYFIIPAIITVIMAFVTNMPQNIVNVAQNVNQTVVNTNGTVVASTAVNMIPKELLANLMGSLALTFIVAAVLFIIFSFFQYMANARLANTDSLSEALNIPEAFRDLSRIGYGKVIATVFLMVIIVAVINAIIGYVVGEVPAVSIVNIVVTPFLMFAMNRVNGLLYSDIA